MSISDNNTQILNDIQSLQNLEQEMFSNLEENPNLTTDQQEQIVQKINQISQMRLNLYKTLSSINGTYGNLLNNSNETLKEQTMTISIVEKELNESKKRLEAMEEEKNNKIRLIEINNYYSQQYSTHSKIFQILLWILIPLILIVWLRNKEFIPSWAFASLFFIVVFLGLWNLLPVLYSMWQRDNMNYQEYYWQFDIANAPEPSKNATANSKDPWLSTTPPPSSCSSNNNDGSSMCQGQQCCDSDSTYDPSKNVCVLNAQQYGNGNIMVKQNYDSIYNRFNRGISRGIYNTSSNLMQGISNVSNNLTSTLTGFRNYPESFENLTSSSGSPNANNPIIDALTRPERENRFKKPDVTLDWSPQPSAGQSFVQFNGF